MKQYLSATDEFGITESGIDLMRSKFHYATINWKEINALKISHGKELRYWWVILIIGIALLLLGAYFTFRTFDILLNKEHPMNYVKMLQFLLILLIGGFFVVTAFRSGPLLHVNYLNNKKLFFPIRKIEHEQGMDAFKANINRSAGKVVFSN